MDTPNPHETDALVERKVRHRVARKVLKDLHRQAEDINQQVDQEKQARTFILPIVLVLTVVVILMLLWPALLKFLSTLLNAG